MASGRLSGAALMERAGAAVVAEILARWPELAATPGTARVLCGPGHNGGDGYVVARLLAERGWAVTVHAFGDPARLPPDAAAMRAAWAAWGPVGALEEAGAGADLVVDALFGIGLSRPVPEAVRRALGQAQGRVVAVDLPSGICAETGRDLGAARRCDLTVTFHRRKLGHVLGEGPAWCGALRVVDIGLEGAMPAGVVQEALPAREALAKRAGHKFDHGHALVLSGPSGRGGAARLAARGALRMGAGLVTLGTPPEALAEHAARLDAVMLRAVADAGDLAALLEDRRISALCLGPGMGSGAREAGLLAAACAGQAALVLDADALTLLARAPEGGAVRDGVRRTRSVLTPHGGEFARLWPDLADRLAASEAKGAVFSKVEACRAAAARVGAVVLFKGPDTVIAAPDGRCAVHVAAYERAAPWLATAGSGDVLAGFICGALARGLPPFEAACTSAWLHGEAARRFGPGLIAEDLPETLPGVFRDLGL